MSAESLVILQLNVEGLTTAKLDVLEQVATKNKATVVLLQETHKENDAILKLPGFTLAGHTKSKHHGTATFIKEAVSWSPAGQCCDDAEVEWIATKVQDTTVVNVYKPPPSRLEQGRLPDFPAPAVYAGDFNSWHTDWGYKHSNQDGEFLAEWFSSADAILLFDPKEPSSFISGRWNTETNPDLAFAKVTGHEPLPVRRILDRFPRSQHRPSLITTPLLVQLTEGKPVRRWNFRKASWADFGRVINTVAEALPVPTASNINDAYEAYCKMLMDAAKRHVPRGVRKNYVPCWDEVCEELLYAHNEARNNTERATAATDLLTRLNAKRRERWTETVESIDFTHSSRRAWQTINKLIGQATKPKPTPCPITADAIAAQLISNGRFPNADKPFTRKTTGEVNNLRRVPSVDSSLSGDFTNDEMVSAIKHLKPNKAPGIDNIHSEFILHQGSKATQWLRSFCSVCFRTSKLPKKWRRAKVIALLKPNKPADDPKGYRPIALLCVPYKIMERLLHGRLDPVIDPKLPKEQAGFRRGKSTADQVTLLTQDIENSFQRGEKAGVILLDLTAAYDTVWLRGLHLKLLQMIPDHHMVGFIMEMLSNRSFTLHTSDGQHSRLRRLKNGVPQGSVLAPMLFNIYMHDIPDTLSKKYSYADDLAILTSDKSWEMIESGLTADMNTLSTYLKNWRLKLSEAKTLSSVFHLNNRLASRKLNIKVNNNTLQFQASPTYLGVKLDRTLTFRQHLENLSAKTSARVALIRRLAGTTWGASTKTLRTSTQALVFSSAEYCAPVWCRSSHTNKLDTALNNALRTVSGCLRATPVNQLPILAGIAPPTLRREAAVLALSRKALNNEDHLLHQIATKTPQHARLKSRRPFAEHANQLLRSTPADVSKRLWLTRRWTEEWQAADHSRLHRFVDEPDELLGEDLPRRQWTTLNRLRTGVGRFAASMKGWGLRDSAACDCGHPEQTVDHIIEYCPQHRPPNGEQGIIKLDDDTRAWLAATELQV